MEAATHAATVMSASAPGYAMVLKEYGNKTMGKAKKTVGKWTDNPELEEEGMAQETTGKVQGGVRKAARKMEKGLGKAERAVNRPKRPAKRGKT